MPTLLIVHHSPTPDVRLLAGAVIAGANDDAIMDVEVVVRGALETTADDVLAADGYLLGTTANFGYLAIGWCSTPGVMGSRMLATSGSVKPAS